MITFAYDGGANLTATFDSIVGHVYELYSDDPSSSVPSVTATGTTTVLSISDIAGVGAGDTWYIRVADLTGDVFLGASVLEYGTTSEYAFSASWSFDGSGSVSVTWFAVSGHHYRLHANLTSGPISYVTFTGTGALHTRTYSTFGPLSPGQGVLFYLEDLDGGPDVGDLSARYGVEGSTTLTDDPVGPPTPGSSVPVFDGGPVFKVAA